MAYRNINLFRNNNFDSQNELARELTNSIASNNIFAPKTLSSGPVDPEVVKSKIISKNILGMIDDPNQKLQVIKNRRMSLNQKLENRTFLEKESVIDNTSDRNPKISEHSENHMLSQGDKNSNIISQLVLREEKKTAESREQTYSKYFKSNKIAVSKLINPIFEESKDSLSNNSKNSLSNASKDSVSQSMQSSINSSIKDISNKKEKSIIKLKRTNSYLSLTKHEIDRSNLIKKYTKWLRRTFLLKSIFILLSISFIIVDNEIEWPYDPNITDDVLNELYFIRLINLVVCAIMLLLIFYQKFLSNEIFKKTFAIHQTIINFKGIVSSILETAICCMIIPPWIDSKNEYYIIEDKRIISMLGFLKLYIFFENVIINSPFQNNKVKFLKSMINLEQKKTSLLQSWFSMNKNELLIFFPIVFFPLFTYLLSISERINEIEFKYNKEMPYYCIKENDFFSFLWLTGVSFFTIGYGDVVPCTKLGKVILIIIVILGFIYNSLFINIISQYLLYEKNESYVDNVYKESKFIKKINITAMNFIQSVLVRYVHYKKFKKTHNITIPQYFKNSFLYSKYKTFYLFADFKRLRTKFKLVNFTCLDNEEDNNNSIKQLINKYKERLEELIDKLEHYEIQPNIQKRKEIVKSVGMVSHDKKDNMKLIRNIKDTLTEINKTNQDYNSQIEKIVNTLSLKMKNSLNVVNNITK